MGRRQQQQYLQYDNHDDGSRGVAEPNGSCCACVVVECIQKNLKDPSHPVLYFAVVGSSRPSPVPTHAAIIESIIPAELRNHHAVRQ